MCVHTQKWQGRYITALADVLLGLESNRRSIKISFFIANDVFFGTCVIKRGMRRRKWGRYYGSARCHSPTLTLQTQLPARFIRFENKRKWSQRENWSRGSRYEGASQFPPRLRPAPLPRPPPLCKATVPSLLLWEVCDYLSSLRSAAAFYNYFGSISSLKKKKRKKRKEERKSHLEEIHLDKSRSPWDHDPGFYCAFPDSRKWDYIQTRWLPCCISGRIKGIWPRPAKRPTFTYFSGWDVLPNVNDPRRMWLFLF